jgi:hypothetical protein
MTALPPPERPRFCGACGVPAAAGATACEFCKEPLPSAPTPAPQAQSAPAGPPLRLGSGESIWRTYKVTRLRRAARGEGILYVTNVRVIFHGVAHPRGVRRGSALIQETRVEGITGLTVHRAERLAILVYLALAFFGLATLALLKTGPMLLAFVFALITAGIAWMVANGAGRKGTTGLLIHSSASQATPVALGHFGQATGNHLVTGWSSLFALLTRFLNDLLGIYDALDLLIGFQGPDAEAMVAELGALIYDLQTSGDLARGAWDLPMLS